MGVIVIPTFWGGSKDEICCYLKSTADSKKLSNCHLLLFSLCFCLMKACPSLNATFFLPKAFCNFLVSWKIYYLSVLFDG